MRPLEGPKSKRKNKIVSQEDCDVGKLREIALKICKLPQNLLTYLQFKNIFNVLHNVGDELSGTIKR